MKYFAVLDTNVLVSAMLRVGSVPGHVAEEAMNGDIIAYRKSTRSVKKTLTIPEWLNTEAEKRHINFSSVLQQALIATIE